MNPICGKCSTITTQGCICDRVNEIIDYAKERVYTTDMLKRVIAGDTSIKQAGDDPGMVLKFDPGIRCVFSYEDQPIGRCAHLSVSCSQEQRKGLPPVQTVATLMKLFGMGHDLNDCLNIWIEPEWYAVNVLRLAT